ncbi:unnamed protein product, partial [Rotaria socialis]
LFVDSSHSALTISRNGAQYRLNPACQNDYDQPSDFVDENIFNHLSTTSIPLNDSQLKSPMALRNETQLSINTQRSTDAIPDPTNENTISNSNLKQKRKQSQSSFSSMISTKQSSGLGAK